MTGPAIQYYYFVRSWRRARLGRAQTVALVDREGAASTCRLIVHFTTRRLPSFSLTGRALEARRRNGGRPSLQSVWSTTCLRCKRAAVVRCPRLDLL